jgi:lysophospholipase L1-like esterase
MPTLRRDNTSAGFISGNPVLAAGEHGYETDTEASKIGDGVTAWGSLPYTAPNPSSGALSAAFVANTSDGLDKLSTRRSSTLLPFHAALANRHYKLANIAVLGDSIVEGQGATVFERRWITRLQDQLRAKLPTQGLTGGGRGFIASFMSGETSYTAPTTTANLAPGAGTWGPKRQTGKLDAAGKSVTFNIVGTSIDILYLAGSTGVISITVDGGTATTLNTAGTLLDGRKYRVTFGAGGAHTVVIAYSSGAGSYVHGVIEYNGDENKGIQVHDCGHYGFNSGTGGSGWLSVDTSAYGWPAAVAALGVDLLVIAIGTNDPGAGISPTQHQTNVTNLISVLRAGYAAIGATAPPIVLAPYGGPGSASATWADYVTAQHSVGASDSKVVVADLSLRVPNAATNTGAIYTDTVGHLSDIGHSLFGDIVSDVLKPR